MLPPRAAARNVDTPIAAPDELFHFPESYHLLITTPRHVFAWDAAELRTVFSSRRGGIVTAREAKDGSGILAVADKNVVVLHDSKRGQERSWGLNADEDTVRHLEYSHDSRSLFLSTTNGDLVHHYSTEQAKLLAPVHNHASAPVVMAVSPTGHLMISASDNPPVVYLKNLLHNTQPALLLPEASKSTVSHAAFHPERPNIFLLAFTDATVAAYDATKLRKRDTQATPAGDAVYDGEIGHLQSLHRAVGDVTFTSAPPIVGATFLPGYKTRAVTASSDGRCRVFDFAKGGVILRTWHAQNPLTSICVAAIKSRKQCQKECKISPNHAKPGRSNTIGGPTSTNNLVAVSRVDGQVHIFDGVGRLLTRKTISSKEEKILSIEWVKGKPPGSIRASSAQRHFSESDSLSSTRGSGKPTDVAVLEPVTHRELDHDEHLMESKLGLPGSLRKSQDAPPTGAPRRFVTHPDETDAETICYKPGHNQTQPKGAEFGFSDLFSPIKPMDKVAAPPTERLHMSSPPRVRPRISSQTFVEGPSRAFAPGVAAAEQGQQASNDTLIVPTSTKVEQKTVSAGRSTNVVFQDWPRRRVEFRSSSPSSSTGTIRRTVTATASARPNAKIFADLRHLASNTLTKTSREGMLSRYADTRPADKAALPKPSSGSGKPRDFRAAPSPNSVPKQDVHVNHRGTWPIDSSQAPSLDDAGEDIWLTSESEVSAFEKRQRTRRVNMRQGGYSPAAPSSALAGVSKPPVAVSLRAIDGSTEEDVFPAQAHISSDGIFSPASEDVRTLFPRSSSLSPHKKERGSKKQKNATLTEMAMNATRDQFSKSPWARARAGKLRSFPAADRISDQENKSPSAALDGSVNCLPSLSSTPAKTRMRVKVLESEVAHLKGEVLALKAILRRSGVPIPSSIR